MVRAGHRFVRAFTSCFHDLRLLTPCPIPAVGGAILVCNHTSSLDPVLLQASCPRVITWMMAKEYSRIPGVSRLLSPIEPILVERSGRDMAATRAALRALRDGKVIGIFPEGRIEPGRDLLEFQTGIALLALKAGVPVYPAFLEGTQRGKGMLGAFLSPNQVTLAYGPAIDLGDAGEGRESLEAVTERIRNAVAELGEIGDR